MTLEQHSPVGDGETAIGIDLGDIMELLRPRRRRLVFDYLREQEGGEASFNEIVDYACREEFGLGYGTQERKRVYVALYQNHMPTLDSAGVVHFDGTGEQDPVKTGPEFDRVVRVYDNLRVTVAEENEATDDSGRPTPVHKQLTSILRGTSSDEDENEDEETDASDETED